MMAIAGRRAPSSGAVARPASPAAGQLRQRRVARAGRAEADRAQLVDVGEVALAGQPLPLARSRPPGGRASTPGRSAASDRRWPAPPARSRREARGVADSPELQQLVLPPGQRVIAAHRRRRGRAARPTPREAAKAARSAASASAHRPSCRKMCAGMWQRVARLRRDRGVARARRRGRAARGPDRRRRAAGSGARRDAAGARPERRARISPACACSGLPASDGLCSSWLPASPVRLRVVVPSTASA